MQENFTVGRSYCSLTHESTSQFFFLHLAVLILYTTFFQKQSNYKSTIGKIKMIVFNSWKGVSL